MQKKTFAIVGASLAGAFAAHQFRKEGFDGRVILIGAEPHLPYDRPPLSKGVLLGEAEPRAIELWPESDYAQADIDVMLATRVSQIRPQDRTIELENGRNISVDGILLCTGSHPRRLEIPGIELPGVNTLRTLDDSIRIRDDLLPGANVVVIGFGFIGGEVAAAAAKRGCTVTLIEAAPRPMQRVLGPEIAQRYCDLHRKHGVDVRLNTGVAEVRGNGRCSHVLLTDGSEIQADTIIYGVGAAPTTELAESAGIKIDNGIVVDAFCRTSIESVYACGDVASRPSSFFDHNIRLESWQNAYKQGVAAVKSMLGENEPFDDVPWVWTDQYDVKMQLSGLPSPSDDVIWRYDRDSFKSVAFYIREDRVRAVLGFNTPRDVRAGSELIRKRIPVDREKLADESVNLRTLIT